ncbi:hypothetical protein CRUP_026449 [Coryphaenoides rupestris]|nr:hypothetical protein CRUP_026449 [Coryphaenoides rupestris]
MVMVKEAVKELDSRKGVSSQAIRNSIKLKYPTIDLVRLKYTTVKKTKADEVTASKVSPAKKPKAKRVVINKEASEEVPDDGPPKAKARKAKAR